MKNVIRSITKDMLKAGSCWELLVEVNGYKSNIENDLLTQASVGRKFKIISSLPSKNLFDSKLPNRVKVLLLEDGYICWIDIHEILGNISAIYSWQPNLLSAEEIRIRIPKVLKWVEIASKKSNEYLWGGAAGPDFDCSGLIQSAFASQEIWVPRDAYQQEAFSEIISISPIQLDLIIPGDLIFFGTLEKCTHVGLYIDNGLYWHSSGVKNGRNGIGIDVIDSSIKDPISQHYYMQFRSVGRIIQCHDGKTLD